MRLPAILLALTGALLTGCFSVEQPVIPVSDAVFVPDLEGDYTTMNGDDVRIEAAASGNDHVGRGKNNNGEVEIVIRARPVGPYLLLQTHDATGAIPGYRIVFASVVSRGLVVHSPQGNLIDMARRFGLSLDAAANLTGPGADILSFLEDVAQMPTADHLLLQR